LYVWKLTDTEPVNTDPVLSPKKQRSSAQEKPAKPEKNTVPISKSRSRARLNISRTITPPELPICLPDPVPTAEINLDALPPKTPALEAIFSPPSTEPSTQRPESKDTPPPGDLSSADQIGASRPGRRARPAVSYKEPSLNTKMRRPDAKLVDAIVERRTSVDHQTAPLTSGKPAIKREGDEEGGWKPVSSLIGRTGEEEVEVGSPLRQKLDRKGSDQDAKTSPPYQPLDIKTSTASKAISALINETSTAKRKAATASTLPSTKAASEPLEFRDATMKEEDADKDKLAIFDFTDSSPVDTAPNPRTRINELAKAARNARRHSAMPTPSVAEAERSEKPQGALPSVHKRTGSGNVNITSTTTLSRSESTMGLGKSSSAARLNGTKEKKPVSIAGGLPATESSMDLRAKADAAKTDGEGVVERMSAKETAALRAERAASRRKSMML
jgi:hypothetical protein